ncbi:MAG: hypothetical protein WCI78_18675 [Mycobacterium sp.]
MEIGCPSCWGAITTTVYRARRDMVIRCPGCGMSVALGTRAVQDAADEAGRMSLAEQARRVSLAEQAGDGVTP